MSRASDAGTVPISTDPVDALRASWRGVSRGYAAYLAAMVVVGQAGTPGWETAEIEAALTFTGRRADSEYTFAEMLVLRLPLVFAALEAGHIDHHKARVFADYLADLTDAQIERICSRLVPLAYGWTTGQLAARLLREVQAVDRHYTRRRYQRAVQERGVCGYLAADGTATITAHGLTPSEAAAAADRLVDLAAVILRAGYPGTVHQVRADLFVRLLDGRYNGFSTDEIVAAMLRGAADLDDGPTDDGPTDDGPTDDGPADDGPTDDGPTDDGPTGGGPDGRATASDADSSGADGVDGVSGSADSTTGDGKPHTTGSGQVPRPEGARHGVEVRIGLATLLGLDDHPAELPGWGPVLAEDARLLVARQRSAEWIFAITDDDGYLVHGGLIRTRPPAASAARCRGGTVEIHISAARLLEWESCADLPTEWSAVIAEIARQHAAWRARPGDRDACLDRYPTSRFARAGLRRHVRLRDRTCVAPGCRRPARKADQDHTHDRAHGGRTERANLGPLCERHHLMKHEGGWRLEQPQPGRFVWHSPLGQVYRTRGDPIAPDLPDPVPRNNDPDCAPVAVGGPTTGRSSRPGGDDHRRLPHHGTVQIASISTTADRSDHRPADRRAVIRAGHVRSCRCRSRRVRSSIPATCVQDPPVTADVIFPAEAAS